MTRRRFPLRRTALTLAVLTSLAGAPALAQDADMTAILERLERLERQQAEQQAELEARDRQIEALESELAELRGRPAPAAERLVETPPPVAAPPTPPPPEPRAEPVSESTGEDAESGFALAQGSETEPEYFGQFQVGGKGFKVADTPYGDLNVSLFTYARYLNQDGLDDTYTDAFDRTRMLDTRNDLQLQKAVLYFKGWVGDPRLRYLAYVWSSNTNQGLGAQVVVAGNLTYVFDDAFNLSVGINGLPTTRSTEGNFPNWLRVDNRTIADEFFRGSFTTGISAFGQLGETFSYKAMLGNNLSQLGVDAGQLNDELDTFAGALIWTPQGFYNNGFGDYEQTEEVRTRFGLHLSQSTEDRQSQPDQDDPENSQIRLSDGTVLFTPRAFATEGRVNEARYRMASLDAGIKYRGFALEGEYYYRWVDDFVTEGFVPVDELKDHGFQLQASAMLVPKVWQAYLSGSKIYGEYGNPWDVALGVNWFPLENKQFRVNGEVIFIDDSPVGYFSVPYIVGADGTIFYVNTELRF